jgi:hypothetical protein
LGRLNGKRNSAFPAFGPANPAAIYLAIKPEGAARFSQIEAPLRKG